MRTYNPDLLDHVQCSAAALKWLARWLAKKRQPRWRFIQAGGRAGNVLPALARLLIAAADAD